MARILDANIAFSGHEPKFSIEITPLQLSQTLNWYSQNKSSKDSLKYAVDYFKKKLKLSLDEEQKKVVETTFGFVCRIITHGATLPEKNQIWFENFVDKVKNTKKKIVVTEEKKPTNVISIQDRIREKASECIGELEGQLDDYIQSEFSGSFTPYAVLHTLGIKGAHTTHLVQYFKRRRGEFEEVLNTDDKELKEGYSNFTKPQMKKIIAWCDQGILDCSKVVGESAKTRKPRKRKVKSPEELVAKLKYCEKFDELKLVSIAPKDIIGSMQLWVYNTKTRKLGCYHADDAGGLQVKGSTIENFSETKSVQKKLRKPADLLPEVLDGGKVFLRNVIDTIKAVDSPLTGRINADTILLRLMK